MSKLRHPAPATIGRYLTDVSKILVGEVRHDARKSRCVCIECEAARLSENGYPVSTSGDGRGAGPAIVVPDENGANDRVPVTSTEAAMFTSSAPFPDLDLDLAKALRTLWASARLVEDLVARIRRCGNDSEQVASLGDCTCCGKFCNPRQDPNDRLRSGFCPACDTAYRRWRITNPDGLRPDFVRWRKAILDTEARQTA